MLVRVSGEELLVGDVVVEIIGIPRGSGRGVAHFGGGPILGTGAPAVGMVKAASHSEYMPSSDDAKGGFRVEKQLMQFCIMELVVRQMQSPALSMVIGVANSPQYVVHSVGKACGAAKDTKAANQTNNHRTSSSFEDDQGRTMSGRCQWPEM
jgi:hypothetical protein